MSNAQLFSMTGFGRTERSAGDWQVLVEIRSLNGKQFELNLKLPPLLKSHEFEIRNLILQTLYRGTVDCSITLKLNGATKPVVLNTDLIRSYYHSLQQISDELQLDTTHVLEALLKLPEVVMPVSESIDAAGWDLVQQTLQEAMEHLTQHRAREGHMLQAEMRERIRLIGKYALEVEALAALRPDHIKENLKKKIEEALGKDSYDLNRLEQEIIFYIEKLDISEELARLKDHCAYFISLLEHNDAGKGKKLGFLLQEIGREINTTGAKAYDAGMQKIVVAMKDELEKAKEQVLNVL
ncbi:MAG TPA: YicC/YloC family endoribonuclease [Phnomibacter sp.]|nr:YicC/YloC family endoribonuclease [Phnomibacter sp.]